MSRRQKSAEEAAGIIVRRFGGAAQQQVAQRIHELEQCGEEEAVLLWREIELVVKAMLGGNDSGKLH